MDSSRSDRARARARHLLAQLAPLPDDSEVQRLRELSMDYIREAERLEKERSPRGSPANKFPRSWMRLPASFLLALFKAKSKGSLPPKSVER